MPQSFGDQLKLFALSIDVVDDDRFDKIGNMINNYCEKVLNIQHTRVFLEDSVEGQPGLARYKLGSKKKGSARRIKNDQDVYNGQSCFAFDKVCPLWIVSPKKIPLSESEYYNDLWDQAADIPPYRPIKEDSPEDNTKMRTSIIVPIERKKNLLGVVNFETTEYLEITSEAKNELKKIAETIYILRSLLAGSQRQQRNTDSAMDQLRKNLKKSQPKLTKPKIFLASSRRAKTDVIDVIRCVLREHGDSIALEYWKENETPGNINEQLLNAISSCRYGICYFSEEHAEGEHQFRDNPNVLFEAGMFHGRSDDMAARPNSWIPIREFDSPEIPFDFAQERIICVNRDNEGHLYESELKSKLSATLSSLISD